MPRFAANLTFLYGEHDFLDRFAAAARDGFRGVEFLFPYEHKPAVLSAKLQEHGLTQVLFNAPPGDWVAGERGIASLPGRQDEFRRGMECAFDYAQRLGCKRLHVMSGLIEPGADRAERRAILLENLAWAAPLADAQGITLLLECINGRDMPGYFLQRQDEALSLCREIETQSVRLQFDAYHARVMEGDPCSLLREYHEWIGHVQVACMPGRNEPDETLDPFFWQLDELGYAGWVGCEYHPRASTSAGLGWLARWSVVRAFLPAEASES